MNSANQAAPTPSTSAEEVWTWMQNQKKPITFQHICDAETLDKKSRLLLPVYGKILARKLNHLHGMLAENDAKIKSILDTHLRNLLTNVSYDSSAYSLKSKRFEVILELLKDFRVRPFPIQDARASKLHRIPKQDDEPISLCDSLDNLEKTKRQAVSLMLNWFGGREDALVEDLCLPAKSWLEVQMTLLRLQALPGLSYYDALASWNKEQSQKHGPETPGCKLYKIWVEQSPFFLLLTQNHREITPDTRDTIVIKRPAGLVLDEEDTFQSYLIRCSVQAVPQYISKIKDIKDETFTKYFDRFEPLFLKEPLRPTILYFLMKITYEYKNASPREAPKLLPTLFKLLKRLLYTEEIVRGTRQKELPRGNEDVFSFLLTILLYYHTSSYAPSSLSLDGSWFVHLQNLTIAEKKALCALDYVIPLESSVANCSLGNSYDIIARRILKTIAKRFPQAKFDAFQLAFHKNYAPLFKDERPAPAILYIVEVLSNSYQRCERLHVKERLFGSLALLNAFPSIVGPVRSFLVKLALFYHTILLAPSNLPLDLSWFDLFMNLDAEQVTELMEWWKELIPAKNESLEEVSDIISLFTRWTTTPFEKIQLLSEITADICDFRPNKTPHSLKSHIFFLRRIEELCSIRLQPQTGFFALTSLPLTAKILPLLTTFAQLKEQLLKYTKNQVVDLPAEFIKKATEFFGDLALEISKYAEHVKFPILPDDLPEEDYQKLTLNTGGWEAVVPYAVSYSLTPQSLGCLFSRLFVRAYPAPADEEKLKVWQWAELRNGALREVFSGSRAIRATLSWNQSETELLLEIFWVESISIPTTRRVKVSLPITKAFLQQHPSLFNRLPKVVEQLGQDLPLHDESLENIPIEFVHACKRLKCELRKAIIGQSLPFVHYDDSTRRFSFGNCPNPEAIDGFQVNISEYEALFAGLLVTQGEIEKAFSTRIWTGNGYVRKDIDFKWQQKIEKCMGEDDEDTDMKNRDFYHVTLAFNERPEKSYSMTYVTRPTPLLLAWQLALLKEQY